jgi:amino acid adenylation domain-containing protein/FkbH-like protein
MSSAIEPQGRPGLTQKRALVADRLRKVATGSRRSPLSFAQQRLWFLDQLEPNSCLYNIGSVARVDGGIDTTLLEQSIDAVVGRHEALRTRFICPDENPVQIVDPHRRFQLEVVDLSSCAQQHDREVQAHRLVRAELNRPFNLSSQHPLRATLIRLRPDEHRLVLTLHHIVADEWSLRVLFKELATLYSAYASSSPVSLPGLPIQYADYARWQRQWLQGDVLNRQLEYWKNQLKGYPPVTELPTDHARGLAPTFNGRTASRRLSSALTEGLRDLAKRCESTLFMVLLAAFKTLVYRYTRQEDLIVCSPVAGRTRVETEGLIGFFVNTLVLRTSLAGDPSFEQLLARVREVTLGAMEHQDLPFDRLVEELQPERSLTHLPFTKLMFAFQSGMPELLELSGARLRFVDVETDLAKFEITLVLRENSEGLLARLEYNCDLFDKDMIERLLGHLETLLAGIVDNPAAPISRLPLLTPAERNQVLIEWNQTETEYPRDRCIHELFEAQAEATPEAIAVVWGHQKMSYRELNSRANQLARSLKRFEVKPDVPVGLCVERSLEMVVGILGVLKAGGAYVPLDATYPKERLAFMLEDTRTPVILTQQRLLGRLPRTSANVLCLDADWELIGREPRENTANLTHARHLAYIMYTSGSTGQPKGVAVPHRAVNRLVLNTNFISLDASDRVAQVSNISFDAATFELWGALLNGAQLVGVTKDITLSPKDFANELREQGITAMFLTAALFNQLASEAPGAFETLRTVIAGGEALDPKWVSAVLRNRPPQRLLNGYGPTENTTFTCCHLIRELRQEARNVPIGRPISNTTVYILDPHLNPVPIGVPGELYTGGDGLARGYWNRCELTPERFVSNPFDETKSGRIYQTGDLARYLADGTIEFLGRVDDQVKIRGHRIELGEIETQLGRHPAIRECVVTVCGTSSANKRLIAYIVPAGEPAPNASQLRCFLGEKLPDYMIPSTFVSLSALPLTSNGKVDRKALPAPDQTRPSLDRQYVPPRDMTERQLAAIWEAILGVRPVGIQDKFFDLGGHSMLAVRVIAQIEKVFGRKLRLATLFQAPTIERLAPVLRQEVKESSVTAGTSLVEIQGAGSRPRLFLVHGAGGGMFWGYVNLARCLGTDQPVYGFKSRGLDGHKEFTRLEEMAAQYILDLRSVQPHGPYYLGGYCFGGNVAYEMACQLTEQGEKVALLALLNCAPPNSRYARIPWTPRWGLKFARNLLYWANYFGHWSTNQRREFFRWKWHLLMKRLTRARGGADFSRVEPGDLVDLSSYTQEQKVIWETHIRGLMNFRPRSYQGEVHLFRSTGHPLWCSFDEDYGWGDLAKRGVKLITVPGAHEKILEEPWVKALAQDLSAALLAKTEPPSQPVVQSPDFSRHGVPEVSRSLEATTHPSPTGNRGAPASSAASESEAHHLAFWKRQLGDAAELLDLPSDRPRLAQMDDAPVRYPVALKGEIGRAVLKLASELNCEPFVVFLAIFATLLQRYTGNHDVVVGSAVPPAKSSDPNNRPDPANPFALRCNLSGDPTVYELVARLVRTVEEGLAHSAVPFEKVVVAVRPKHSSSYHPIFQVALTVKSAASPEASDADLNAFPIDAGAQAAKPDLSLNLAQNRNEFSGCIEYSPALFDSARISRLAQHFETLLNNATAEPSKPISRLELLPEHEAETLLHEWTATEKDFPQDKTLIGLFHDQVLRAPDAEALVCGNTRLTYRQLYAYAEQIAGRLGKLGVTNEVLVGVCMERSAEMVGAILGTLLAGAAYVPLDIKYPKDRLSFTLRDAQVKVLLTQSKLLPSIPELQSPVCCLDSLDDLAGDGKCERMQPTAKPSDLAYVIYTSGSTGKPKGVALEHRGAVALVSWAMETFSAEELSGVLASTSICFDLSVFELFVPLCCGGKVILADNALALPTLPAAREVRLINTVPSAIRELLRLKAVPGGVRVINLAGEPLSSELVNQIYSQTSVEKVFDLYGPTETTTYSTGALRKPGEQASIGRPLPNEQVYLLDSSLRPVPIGIPGELFIGGAGLARGYLNRPDLTAEKFIPHPFKTAARLYRTGDLARWRADGNLEYLGRLDYQVKIRGFRIELGEVEAALKNHTEVGATVALAREDHPGDKRLVAYIVRRAEASVSAEELKKCLREQLPEFMVPSDFVFLETMPMTPNGKIDRKALPPPKPPSGDERSDLVAPRNTIEARLAAIWCEVFGLKAISIHDNFFDLGGHSLLAVRIIAAVRDALNVELPLITLFSAPTIAALSDVVSASSSQNGHAPVLAITPISRSGPSPVSYVQERLWFLDQLNPGSAAYNVPTALRLKGPLDLNALRQAVYVLVSRHASLRTSFDYGNGGLTQHISENLSLEIPCIDFQGEPSEVRERVAQDLVNRHARQPFDLGTGPLIRTFLFRLDETDHILLVVMHHTISDGWSLALFFKELGLVYDSLVAGGSPEQLASLPIEYADFARWQRQWMSGANLETELAHWKRVLDGVPPELRLPVDHPRPECPSGKADCQVVTFETAAVHTMSDFARREGCTPFMVFLAALMITLRNWTGQGDLVVGTVVAGRSRREFENILGCFMNFLPLRARLEDGDTGREVLARVRAALLDGQTHQDCPFEKIVEAVNPQRRLNQNPLYNVALLLQDFPSNFFPAKTLQATSMPVSLQAALLDLRFEIQAIPQGLSLKCEYKTELFEPATVQALLASWLKVMETLLRDSESHLPEFELESGLKANPKTAAPAQVTPTIVIASTFTAEPVAESLQYWLRRVEMPAAIEFAPYNQVFQQLLDPDSAMARNHYGLNIILARLEDWQGDQPPAKVSTDGKRENAEQGAAEFLSAIRAAARNSVPFLICFCPPSAGSLVEPNTVEASNRVRQQLEADLADLPGVYLLTAPVLEKWYSVSDYYDPTADELGHVPYTALFFTALGTALARKFHALNRPPYKVIALDCDNTIWSGICGEDGPKAIQLDAARRELQDFMRLQRDSGMLLCLCSKNNEEDVHAVFAERADMPLRMEHFAATRLNWQPKSENLKSLSKELGLGLDSFIFLDDNPVECAEVQAQCPEVLALQLPAGPSLIHSFLDHCWAFDHLKLTTEDRQRAKLYEQNRKRDQLRAEAPTLEEFLTGLDLKISIEPISPADWPRVAQLTQRTNQFNFTTRRLNERDLGLWLNVAEGLTVTASDRFGDYGLVGTILYRVKAESLEVDTLLLSCRVLGRGVEHRMLAHLGEICRDKSARWVDVHFVPTTKNKPALDFLERLGSAFKQPLNGGSVFRIPVDFAAQIAFQPASGLVQSGPENNVARVGTTAGDIPDPGRRFSNYRAIALEANDVKKIHHEIKKGAALRHREHPNYVAPRNDLERRLCRVWQDLLHVQPVGVHDDFFELGGHSLLAVRLFAEIHKFMGRKFPLVTLFQAPTLEQLAGVLAQCDGANSLLVPIQPQGNKPPLFLVHGAGGDVLWGYANLATYLTPDQPVYGIKSHGQEGLKECAQIEEMARAYLEVVKTRQAEGPYLLGGYCFGGNVAYEMARQLKIQGHQVSLVVLIDTAPSNVGYERLSWWRSAFAWRFARNFWYWFGDFIALAPQERRRFFIRKLGCLGRKLKRRLGRGIGPVPFDLEEVIDPQLFPEHELNLWRAHLEALVAHTERPYDGPVALLRTRGQPLLCSLEEDFCWGKLVRGGVSVQRIPGSHENIFMEPNVRVLASELNRLLQQAQTSSPTKPGSSLLPSAGQSVPHP